jgi:hypothetical protein
MVSEGYRCRVLMARRNVVTLSLRHDIIPLRTMGGGWILRAVIRTPTVGLRADLKYLGSYLYSD